MRAVILSIGTELLRGDIVDSNAAYLGRELSQLGFEVLRIQAIRDELNELTDAVRGAMNDASITVTTGGLGPTQDDLTRDAIAASLAEKLYFDEALYAAIEERFALLQRRAPASNRRQAMLIPSATTLANPHGTAPGWYVAHQGRVIVAMPGPPHEMQPMWQQSGLPRVSTLLPGHCKMLSLMTFGLGESAVEERIDKVIHWHSNVTIATYAKEAGVQVHLTARAPTEDEAVTLIEGAAEQLRKELGPAIYGCGEDTLSSVVGRELVRQGLTLAIMESATGGALASMVTDTPGSSDYFRGGIVAYSREAKRQFGVDGDIMERDGLISSATAQSMASAARRQMSADVGIGLSGIAGSDSLEGKPPGTCYVAISMEGLETARGIHRPGNRQVAKRIFAQSALDLLRRQLSTEGARA